MSELVISGVTVRYATDADPVTALSDVSMVVSPGRLLAVTGPSGAGKSTLLWVISGALRPDEGDVTLAGDPIVDRESAAASGVALVPQGNGLAASLTAAENVLVPLLAGGIPPDEAARRVDQALTTVGLEESGNHLIEELSGGQQQRVALARTFASRARLLVADEPTSDLDAANRERMVSALRDEARRGAIVVMATHDPEAAEQADGEVHLDQGVAAWVRRPS